MSDQETEPIHVQFARECLGWTDLRDIETRPHVKGQPLWVGVPPGWRAAIDEADWKLVPRVDLPGQFDLTEWIQVNNLFIQPLHVMNPDHTQTWEVADYEDKFYRQSDTLREAVLRCLVALFKAGKLVRP